MGQSANAIPASTVVTTAPTLIGSSASAAINQASIPAGGVVIDVGRGTGRALPPLRQAVGPHGAVIAVDVTPEMLGQARPRVRAAHAALFLADARHLPFGTASADAVFAAGLLTHMPDTEGGLRQLARVTRPCGLLILFHPSGRAALAARHGRTLEPDEPLAAIQLRHAFLGRAALRASALRAGARRSDWRRRCGKVQGERAGLRSGDGLRSVRARPSSLKNRPDRKTFKERNFFHGGS